VLTATHVQVKWKGRNLTPYSIETLESIAKKLAQLIRSTGVTGPPICQIWWQTIHEGHLGKHVKYNVLSLFLFISLFIIFYQARV